MNNPPLTAANCASLRAGYETPEFLGLKVGVSPERGAGTLRIPAGGSGLGSGA